MAITLQTILSTNSFSASRIIINNNFTAVKTSIDALDSYLNSSTGALNVTSTYVERGSNPIATTLLTCEASGVFGGNLSVNGTSGLTSTSITASTGITVTGGDVMLTNASNKLDISGKLVLDGEIVHKDFGNSFIEAADPASYATVSGTQATLAVTGVHSILLDFTTYNVPSGKNIISVELPVGNTTGQTLEIIVKTGAITGVFIDNINMTQLTTETIQFSNSPFDYQSAQFRWTGTTWIITNVLGATIA
jgi:hypothetical protein